MDTTPGYNLVESTNSAALNKKKSHSSSGSETSHLSSDPYESDRSHNVSTISSSYQIQQPRFLEQIGFTSPTTLHSNEKVKKSLMMDNDIPIMSSEIVGTVIDENDEHRKSKILERRMSRKLFLLPSQKRLSMNPSQIINLGLPGSGEPSPNGKDGHYLAKLKGEDQDYTLATPSKTAGPTPKPGKLSKHLTNIMGWKEVANAFKKNINARRSHQQAVIKRASVKECEFIADKSHSFGRKHSPSGDKTKKHGMPKKMRFKELLEKHSIIKRDVKSEFVRRLLRKMSYKKKTKMQLVMEKIVMIRKNILLAARILKHMSSNLLMPWRPQGVKRILWDIFSAFCTLYEIVFIPFYLAFDFQQSPSMMRFEFFKDMFFFCEVLLNFHTAYMSDGSLDFNHKRIAKRYLRSWFPIDLVANIPYVEILMFSTKGFNSFIQDGFDGTYTFYKLLRLLRIIKWVKITRVLSKFQSKIQNLVVAGTMGLVSLLIYIIFMAHWMACIWHYVGRAGLQDGSSWIITFGFVDQSTTEQYVASLYWAITTMLTVGYGDLTPVNVTERMTNIFCMLAGCCMFAYSMNSIGILLQNINQDLTKKQQKYSLVSKYLKRKNVPKITQKKVEKYLDYLFENSVEKVSEEEGALKLLSDTLQCEIQNEINGSVLRENQLFNSLFGNKFLALLSRNLEEKILSPGDIVFDEADTEFGLYFIAAGVIELYLSNASTPLQRLEKDSHFGEISFFSDKPRTAAAKSITFSSTFLLKKSTFLSILEKHEPEKEIYHDIKDKINLNQDYTALKLTCHICDSKGHFARMCPNIHFNLNPEEVIKKHIEEERTERMNFLRSNERRKFNVLPELKEIQLCSKEYYQNNINHVREILNLQRPSVASMILKQRQSNYLDKRGSERSPLLMGERRETKFSILNNDRRGTNLLANITGERRETAKIGSNIALDFQKKKMNRKSTFHEDKEKDKAGSDNYIETQYDIFKGYETMRGPRETMKNIMKEEEEEDLLEEEGLNEQELLEAYEQSLSRLKGMSKAAIRLSRAAPLIIEFDAVKNYSLYLPHNNITKIAADMQKQKVEKARLKNIQKDIEDVKNKVEQIQFPKLVRRTSMFAPNTHTQKRRRTNASFFPNNEV